MPAPLFGCKWPSCKDGRDKERNPIAMSEMNALDIARRMVEFDRPEDACRAYTLTLAEERPPDETLEAALYILQSGGNYKVAYDSFLRLYAADYCRKELLALLTEAFYLPNVKLLKNRYEKNCKLLQKYPYLFRQDFPAFETLPMRFYPYDDNGFLPFDIDKAQFGDYVNFNHPVVSRNFFHDLENPILAADVFSQYELEYLNDNVRPSEWVGRENHIYLHYTNWGVFCAHLQVWNLRSLLEDKKIVFLIGDELVQYPVDFKTRFAIDYSVYPVKPLGIREINRLIWHTQLSAHNGGDFFNEVCDNHPNLVATPSFMLNDMQTLVENLKKQYLGDFVLEGAPVGDHDIGKLERVIGELRQMKNPTDKDFFVALFLCMSDLRNLDDASRIAPAIFFQPHFSNIRYRLISNKNDRAILDSEEYRKLHEISIFRQFRYIKTFTPMRRPTTSAASTVKFMKGGDKERAGCESIAMIPDVMMQRVLNRSFMIDGQDRLFKDSILVRFEDGKLNPKATFTALAAFLDIPYTKSMTYCSLFGELDPESLKGNDRGFSPAAIYRTYDEYMGVPERYFLEYFMRDVYEYYGYGFQYYDGAPVDMDKICALVGEMDIMDALIREATDEVLRDQGLKTSEGEVVEGFIAEQCRAQIIQQYIDGLRQNRIKSAEVLLRGLRFVNLSGHPLRMMPRLQLDPALLEQPLYH